MKQAKMIVAGASGATLVAALLLQACGTGGAVVARKEGGSAGARRDDVPAADFFDYSRDGRWMSDPLSTVGAGNNTLGLTERGDLSPMADERGVGFDPALGRSPSGDTRLSLDATQGPPRDYGFTHGFQGNDIRLQFAPQQPDSWKGRDFTDAPDFDLQGVLQGHSRGAGGESPFASGNVPLLGDIPPLGELFVDRSKAVPKGLYEFPSDWPVINYRRGGGVQPTAPGSPPPPPARVLTREEAEAVGEHVARIRGLQAEMKYEDALKESEEILKIDPGNPTGLLLNDILTDAKVFKNYNALENRRNRGFAPVPAGGFVAVPARPQAAPAIDCGWRCDEELWVIERRHEPRPRSDDDICSYPSLWTRTSDREVPIPLDHTDVNAHIAGYISTVDVTQHFSNPYSSKIEAVYVFPLPEKAAVSEFVMTVGERHIRGIIREREQAQQIYNQAKSQGYVASLMTQDRPNIFTQSIANIEPGHAIDISIRYYSTLVYSEGAYEFVFPMVIGPRYNPPGTTVGVGAVGYGAAGASGQKTEVQYLRPGQRAGNDIAINVNIDAGVPIERIESPSHEIEVSPLDRRHDDSSCSAQVRLSRHDAIPNRDFILRYEVAGKDVKTALMTHEDSRGKFFTLMIVPPRELSSLKRGPMEMVFVLDASGSMDGKPIEQAKSAVEHGLDQLRPGDTFQLINFAESATQLGREPLDATPENIRVAKRYIEQIGAAGGTEMMNGLRAALNFRHDRHRLRVVAFLTDGYIGNEPDILGELHNNLRDTRVFSFGVSESPNRHLLDSMARIGRGAAAYLGLNDSSGEVMDAFFDRAAHAAMSDVELDFGSADVKDVYPSRIPDLFVGRPIVITGRYTGRLPDHITVRGRAGGEEMSLRVPTTRATTSEARTALPQIWARMKIADLNDRETWERSASLRGDVKKVALDYGMMSQYTAFVAVDSLTRTDGQYGTTVAVPVNIPAGVRYETTVQEGRR